MVCQYHHDLNKAWISGASDDTASLSRHGSSSSLSSVEAFASLDSARSSRGTRGKRTVGGYPCRHPGCTKIFDLPGELNHHARNHVPKPSRPHACPHCTERFLYHKDLARHALNIHKQRIAGPKSDTSSKRPGSRRFGVIPRPGTDKAPSRDAQPQGSAHPLPRVNERSTGEPEEDFEAEMVCLKELEVEFVATKSNQDGLKAHVEQLISRDQESQKTYEEKMGALNHDHLTAVKYLRGTEKMMSKMKTELQRLKKENGDLRTFSEDKVMQPSACDVLEQMKSESQRLEQENRRLKMAMAAMGNAEQEALDAQTSKKRRVDAFEGVVVPPEIVRLSLLPRSEARLSMIADFISSKKGVSSKTFKGMRTSNAIAQLECEMLALELEEDQVERAAWNDTITEALKDKDCMDEFSAIEGWYRLLNDPERTAILSRLMKVWMPPPAAWAAVEDIAGQILPKPNGVVQALVPPSHISPSMKHPDSETSFAPDDSTLESAKGDSDPASEPRQISVTELSTQVQKQMDCRDGRRLPSHMLTDLDLLEDIPEWLDLFGMRRYADCFQYVPWQAMIRMDEEALLLLGVNSTTARNGLLNVFSDVRRAQAGNKLTRSSEVRKNSNSASEG